MSGKRYIVHLWTHDCSDPRNGEYALELAVEGQGKPGLVLWPDKEHCAIIDAVDDWIHKTKEPVPTETDIEMVVELTCDREGNAEGKVVSTKATPWKTEES